jgi:hypothetical protein
MVHIECDPATARDLADAFASAYAACAELEADRLDWMGDVVALHGAAAMADVQDGQAPEVAEVRLLRVVGGELQ